MVYMLIFIKYNFTGTKKKMWAIKAKTEWYGIVTNFALRIISAICNGLELDGGRKKTKKLQKETPL